MLEYHIGENLICGDLGWAGGGGRSSSLYDISSTWESLRAWIWLVVGNEGHALRRRGRAPISNEMIEVKWSEIGQSCPTLCDPMDSRLHQAPPSMGFSRQEYWSGLPFPSPGNLPDPRIKPRSPALIDRHFTIWATREIQLND